MRFMIMVKHLEPCGPPPKALMEAVGKAGEEARKSGALLLSGALAPAATGSRVRVSGGKISVMDGPFSETKEVVGGFAIFEFKSKQEATEAATSFMELHRQHWPGWEGESEIRQLCGPEDSPLNRS